MFRSRKRLRQAQKDEEANDLSGRLVTVLEPASAAAESYRTLRTNLLYATVDTPPKVLVLTSPGPQQGKSTTCANLGVSLIQADKRVLIVDCDFRRPVMHKIFGLRNLRGMVNFLAGERNLQDVWQEPLAGLKVLTVGPIPPNPAELLGSRRFAEFLGQMRREFDHVLIDAPPIELVSDPAILATLSDGVLLILDSRNIRKSSLRRSVRSLEAVGANILGTTINNVKSSKDGYQYNYGYYGN